MRVKHKSRRRGLNGDQGVILVGGSQYQIDEMGEVEVDDQHGTAMLQGACWFEVVGSSVQDAQKAQEDQEANLEAMDHEENEDAEVTREGLLKQADLLGIKVDKRLSKAKLQQAIAEKIGEE